MSNQFPKMLHLSLLICGAITTAIPANAQLLGKAAQEASETTQRVVSAWVVTGNEKPVPSSIRIAIEGNQWTLIAIDNKPNKPIIHYLLLQESPTVAIPSAESWSLSNAPKACVGLLNTLKRSQIHVIPKFNYPPGLTEAQIFVDNGFGATLHYCGDIMDIPGLRKALRGLIPVKDLPPALREFKQLRKLPPSPKK